jgi:hypothetical protein
MRRSTQETINSDSSRTVSQPAVSRVIHEHKGNKASNFKRTAVTFGVVALAGAAFGYLLDRPSGVYSTSVGSGEVLKIVPQTLDVRAEVVSGVETTSKYRSTNLMGKIIGAVGLGGCFGQSEKFTGLSGDGGGQIDSYVVANTLGVRDVVQGNKQTIYIPSSDINLISKIDTAKSEIYADNGDCHDVGATEWKLIDGNGEGKRIEVGQGYLGSIAEDAALNYAQTSCVQNVWPDTLKAVTYAYQEIGKEQWSVEKKAGVNVAAYNPNDISVVVTGGMPHYANSVDIHLNKGYSYQDNGGPKCVEDVGALQLSPNS